MISTKINIWDLGQKVNVKVEVNFIDKINREIKLKFGTKRKLYEKISKFYPLPYSVFKDRTKRGYRYFVDLEILTNLCNLLEISLFELQKSIIAYKTRKGWNSIENPKLPIEITPIFDMLFAHHIGDGTVVDPKKGRIPYFGYRQYDELYRNLYIKKIESIFGKLKYRNPYFSDKRTTRIYSPTVVSGLLFNYYDLDTKSFLSKKARIPSEILNKNWKFKLAFLIGTIIDDGHVDSTDIVIGLKNRSLANDLHLLCQDLGYPSNYTERKTEDGSEYGYVYILKKGMEKFWSDYNLLKQEYSEINLGYKSEQIARNLKIKERPIQQIPGNQKFILKLLFKDNLTVNEIARQILMTRQGVRYHIHKLEKEQKIEKVGIKGEHNYIYGLVSKFNKEGLK